MAKKKTVNKIYKREDIDNGIFEELRKRHPLKSEKTGVCYAQDMDYITLEVEEFNNPIFRKLIKQDSKVFVVYMFLRERMCHKGWYVLWNMTTQEDIIERLTIWGIQEDECREIIHRLIDNGLVKVFTFNDVEYLTDLQQIYNWEMLQAKRERDRKSKENDSDTEEKQENVSPPKETPTIENVPQVKADIVFDIDEADDSFSDFTYDEPF